MSEHSENTVIRMEALQHQLRDHFLGWQCRLRQQSVRQGAGQPTSGMQPELILEGEDGSVGRIVVLIVQSDPYESTAEFRHMVRRTQDPAERYKAAVKHLSATYYQHPETFSDELTALFGPGSSLAERLRENGRCTLLFEQFSQTYRLPCEVRTLVPSESSYQATYWHNSLFNANVPGDALILGLKPDWAIAEADPDLL